MLWERYFAQLVRLARSKLRGGMRGSDEEDVALSAFESFCRRAEAGQFPLLADRDGLWRVLVTITARKAAHHLRDAARSKRGGGALRLSDAEAEAVLGDLLSREPSPEFAAELAEGFQHLLARLDDRELETVALLRMEGYTVAEVAERIGCAPRSVKRKLSLIRTIWESEQAS